MHGFRRGAAMRAYLLAAAALCSACLTGRASTPAERPALEVPPPPPRVIAQVPPPETPMPEPVADLPSGSRPAPAPRTTRPTRDAKDPPKPEPKQEPPPDPVPAPPPAPAPQLRIPETGNAAAASRQIREIIDRSRRILEGVDYRPLNAARRKAYEDAKLFAQQAEDALKASNLVFAKELAEKAERLARELQGR